jgi:hypothetical protein
MSLETRSGTRTPQELAKVALAKVKAKLAHAFTDSDWEAFAGAEEWSSTKKPVIREVNDYLVIGDRNGLVAYQYDAKGYVKAWALHTELNQKAALAFLNGLPQDFEPKTFGFEPC